MFRLYGDYESLSTGYTADALVDFTGGVAERLDLSTLNAQSSIEAKDAMFTHLLQSRENKMLIVCNIAVRLIVHVIFVLNSTIYSIFTNFCLQRRSVW